MKLVTYYIDPSEAEAAQSILCKAGVMAKLSSVDPHIIQPSKSGAERFGLWVVYDDQFEDALILLENPDHVPKRKTYPDEKNEVGSHAFSGLVNTIKLFLKKLRIS